MVIERLDPGELARLGGVQPAAAKLRSLVEGGASVAPQVSEILREVREGGDRAVADCTRRFDTAGAEPGPILVSPEELDEAITQMPLELVAGLQVAIANVALVAEAGVGVEANVDLPQGHRVRLREIPVSSAAVYVPGGRAPYPSTVVMGVVTARAAGVIDVVVCSPPGPGGQIDAAILGTCRLCGVERVYRMGGAQAIAALAYGTESVDAVDVIVGPGNLYVQEAKHQLSTVVGIDGFAGPSDLMVVLGTDVDDAEVELAGLDMLAQAEHGEGSLVVGISPSPAVCDRLDAVLRKLVLERPTVGEAAFAIVAVGNARVGVGAGQRLRGRAPRADRLGGRGAGSDGAVRGLPVRGSRQRDRLRRLRLRLESHPADRRGGTLCLGSLAAALPPPYDRGENRWGGSQAGGSGGADRTRRGLRGACRVDGGAGKGE